MVALVRLAVPVSGVEPIRLFSSSIDKPVECRIVGSGVLSTGDTGKEMGPSLMRDPSRALRAGTNVLVPGADNPKRA